MLKIREENKSLKQHVREVEHRLSQVRLVYNYYILCRAVLNRSSLQCFCVNKHCLCTRHVKAVWDQVCLFVCFFSKYTWNVLYPLLGNYSSKVARKPSLCQWCKNYLVMLFFGSVHVCFTYFCLSYWLLCTISLFCTQLFLELDDIQKLNKRMF